AFAPPPKLPVRPNKSKLQSCESMNQNSRDPNSRRSLGGIKRSELWTRGPTSRVLVFLTLYLDTAGRGKVPGRRRAWSSGSGCAWRRRSTRVEQVSQRLVSAPIKRQRIFPNSGAHWSSQADG